VVGGRMGTCDADWGGCDEEMSMVWHGMVWHSMAWHDTGKGAWD
jgi:hypothetical protein